MGTPPLSHWEPPADPPYPTVPRGSPRTPRPRLPAPGRSPWRQRPGAETGWGRAHGKGREGRPLPAPPRRRTAGSRGQRDGTGRGGAHRVGVHRGGSRAGAHSSAGRAARGAAGAGRESGGWRPRSTGPAGQPPHGRSAGFGAVGLPALTRAQPVLPAGPGVKPCGSGGAAERVPGARVIRELGGGCPVLGIASGCTGSERLCQAPCKAQLDEEAAVGGVV